MKFIKVYNIFDKEYCEKVMEVFDDCMSRGCENGAIRNERDRTIDSQMEMNSALDLKIEPDHQLDLRQERISELFFQGIGEGIERYVQDLHMRNESYTYRNMLVSEV